MIKYRADIDGLRAVAVLAVVLYHFKKSIGFNGYMGVDVFFVISGFLITKIIHREMIEGTFSLQSFYERRIKRIFPAFVTVIFFSTLAAYFLFLPKELLDFSQSALASVFFSSNILFYAEAGYFDAAAELKPLLHTWSLAVEEQFYIVFPLILMGVMRWAKNKLSAVIVCMLVFSFLSNILFSYLDNADAIFYMFPMRAWELLMGSVLALNIVPLRFVSKKITGQGISIFGLFLIVLGFLLEAEQGKFYYLNLIPVVLGTACIIYAGSVHRDLFVTRCLSITPMVFFGKISYSLYLWHWPLYVFSKYYMFDYLPKPHKVGLILLSILLAYLSWRFIEQPMRQKNVNITSSRFMRSGFAAIIGVMVLSGFLIQNHGTAHWHSNDILQVTNAELGNGYEYIETFNNSDDFVFGATDNIQKATVLLLGDSHAEAIAPAIEKHLLEQGKTGLMLRNSCLLPEGFQDSVMGLKKCNKKMVTILNYLRNNRKIDTVIIAQRWAVRTEDWHKIYGISSESYLTLRKDSLVKLIQDLEHENKKIIILAQPPEIGNNVKNIPSIYARMKMRDETSVHELLLSLEGYKKQQKYITPILKHIEKITSAQVVWPHKYLCQGDDLMCEIGDEHGLYYYDDDHLSKYGAEKIAHLFMGYF